MQHLLDDFPGIEYAAVNVNDDEDTVRVLSVLDHVVCYEDPEQLVFAGETVLQDNSRGIVAFLASDVL